MKLAYLAPIALLGPLACATAVTQVQSSSSSPPPSTAVEDPPETPEDGRQAQQMAKLESMRASNPSDGASRYILARAYAAQGARDRALAALDELVAIESWDYRLLDSDFGELGADPIYRRYAQQLEARAPKPLKSTRAYSFAARDILPEGIAWDPKRKALLVGSIHQRQVLTLDAKGELVPLTKPAQDGLLAVLGVAVDPVRDQVLVASAGFAFMREFSPELGEQSAVFAFDRSTGATIGRWDLPQSGSLNDLEVFADGRVFATDSVSGTVMLKTPGQTPGTPLTRILPNDRFFAPNGLVAAPGEEALYVCDFHGIHRVELVGDQAGSITKLDPPAGVMTLGGIDGLERQGSTLLGIQNIFGPGRVWALTLADDGRSLVDATVLEAGHPDFNGPTTGTLADGRFLYLANAALQFNGKGMTPAPEGLRHRILALDLP